MLQGGDGDIQFSHLKKAVLHTLIHRNNLAFVKLCTAENAFLFSRFTVIVPNSLTDYEY